MKKTLLALIIVAVLLLAACGAAGPELSIGIDRNDDTVTAEMTFDQAYENVSVAFHSDVDNDAFTGTADYTCELGAVEPGTTYTAEASTGGGWVYSGEFRNISISDGQFNIVPPDLANELIVITVTDGDTELMKEESTR